MPTTMELLRQAVAGEEFDYQTLLDALAGYASPRDRISLLLRQGAIIRIKKGLYIFGDSYRRGPFCREILANLIYGPSYISLDYALQYYGLIPERVETVTSVTIGRSREFASPVGRFSFRTIPLAAFRTGMDRVELAEGRSCLMAIPEKALADKLLCGRGSGITSRSELHRYLVEELRIDPIALTKLDSERLAEIAAHCRSARVSLLAELADWMRRKRTRHA
jgi:hypothetical protein